MPDEATVDEYLSRPYGRVLSREADGRYSAYVLEWPGCYGEGDTVEEANRSLEESMAAWVEVMIEDGESIPAPLAREYSGRLLLRLPRDTHRRASVRAQAEGVSVNHLICSFVESGLAGGAGQSAERAVGLIGGGSPAWLSDAASEGAQVLITQHTREASTPPSGSFVMDDQFHWGIVRAHELVGTRAAQARRLSRG